MLPKPLDWLPQPGQFVLASLLLGFGLCAPASAQVATLVEDLSSTGAFEVASSNPHNFLDLGGKAIFFADSSPQQLGLWVTDGTSLGTEFLLAVCLRGGSGCSIPKPIRLGNTAYWGGGTLFRSDGTRHGTVRLTNGTDAVSETLVPWVDRVLFTRRLLDGREELWTSDGSAEGTLRLHENAPGERLGAWGAILGEVALFTTFDDFRNSRLWRTDGTAVGTQDITPSRLTGEFGVSRETVGGRALLFAEDSQGIEQLWSSDGTSDGTRQLTNFSNPEWTASVGRKVIDGRYYFFVRQGQSLEIWASDGTQSGTRVFARLPPNLGRSPSSFHLVGGRLVLFISVPSASDSVWVASSNSGTFVEAANFVHASGNSRASYIEPVEIGARVLFGIYSGSFLELELWATDGTVEGTGPAALPQGFGRHVGDVLTLGNTALVLAEDPAQGRELFSTDGTPQGTRRLTDFANPVALPQTFNSPPSQPGDFSRFDNGFLIAASEAPYGAEPWRLGRTSSLAQLVADLLQAAPSSEPTFVRALADNLLFTATDGEKTSLYRATGTTANVVAEIGNNLNLPAVGVYYADSQAYFLARPEGEPPGLFSSDGTVQGTFRLTGGGGAGPLLDAQSFFATVGNELCFTSDDGSRIDLWRSDGSSQGTSRLFEVGSVVQPLPGTGHSWNGEAFFLGRDSATGIRDLWKSDGTLSGTERLTSFFFQEDFVAVDAPRFAQAGGRLIVISRSSQNGDPLLIATDGTPSGTQVVANLFPQQVPESELVNLGDRAFFMTTYNDDFWSLWVTDGTTGGTARLRDFEPLFFPAAMRRYLGSIDGRLFFVANDASLKPQLWSTSGAVADIRQETRFETSSQLAPPQELFGAGGRLFFTADDLRRGRELWMLDDEAEAGARLVHDIAPGPSASNPRDLTVAGNRLYFSADDSIHGRELWSLDLNEAPGLCVPGTRSLCLQNNRFRVEIDWRDFQGNTGRGTPVPLTADTGYFWFFNPANVETIVKVLDGRPINEHFWTFYGALSNVEYTMTVTDAETGLTQRYFNPSRQFASVGDTESFGPNGASLASFTAPNELLFQSHEPEIDSLFDFEKAGICAPSSTRLCLNNGRFAVEATWTDFQGNSGVGMAEGLTTDTGYFWFFRDTNVEVVTKVLDGRPVNGKFWVFSGALSNVEYTLTVTDTATGMVRTYFNPSRRFGSVGDTGAF